MPAPAIGVRPGWAPGPSAQIDWSHPIAQGLVFCWSPVRSNVDMVSGARSTSGTTQFTASQYGVTMAGGSNLTFPLTRTATARTAMCVINWDNSSSGTRRMLTVNASSPSGDNPAFTMSVSAAAKFSAGVGGSPFTTYGESTGAVALGGHVCVATWSGGGSSTSGDLVGWLDGERVFAKNGSSGNQNAQQVIDVGTYAQFSQPFSNPLAFVAYWQGVLPTAAIEQLYADPFCFLRY